ncbi:hypothetical protein BST92_14645 [Nonlabens arenilitoris]|uniref:DUF389 domain-containing protein n=1 Tax=Nonlabens arenilitoris TaxID=1217969 RepID=A0A2S7UFV2_9FLAO|nr:DUF389 domain-containing protein [Nonlabens arenilitoris]PQJ33082.1 hypothetical protein BST92_14645 [Nonlabens arenilitoris]
MESQESQNSQTEIDNSLEVNQQKISGIWDNIMAFLHELLDIRKDSDRDETIESVRKDISFQGHNAWILIFSIFIASIGLNADSTAVVIGAMLISPLMGPIVGMGLGTAINDDTMLRRSLINLGVMMGLSLLTASLYFLITPMKEITSELDARTYPTILDVLIAIFGGLALIVAKAKKGTISNAIAGVAIATALMPPLCTAGYGIATWQLKVFGGAIYLFCINAVFIALSTYLVCKLLAFPMVKYANQAKRKRVSRLASLIGFLVLLPSIVLFYQLLQDQLRQNAVNQFMNEIVQYDGMRPNDDWNKDTQTLDIVMLGAPVPQPIVDEWKKKFNSQEHLEEANVRFYQGSTMPDVNNEGVEIVQEELIDKLRLIQDKDVRIAALEDELRRVNEQGKNFDIISEEVRLNYPQISSISYAESVNKDFITQLTDTIAEYNIRFNDTTLTQQDRGAIKTRMANWLQYRLKTDKIKINELERSVVSTTDTVEVSNP